MIYSLLYNFPWQWSGRTTWDCERPCLVISQDGWNLAGKHLQPLGTSACPWENADVLLQNRFFEVELLTNKFIDEDTTKNENMVAPRRVL